MSLKKSVAALIFPLLVSSNVNAAAVAGSEYWEYLDKEEYLTKEEPFAVYGGVNYEMNNLHAPANYPKTYHENRHFASAYVGFSWLFAPKWKLNSVFETERKWHQDHSTKNDGNITATIEGKIGAVTLRGGGVPVFDALNLTNGGLVIGSYVLGGQVEVPVGNWDIIATGGVIDNDDYDLTRTTTIFDTDSTYLGLTAQGDIGKKISASVGVHNMHNTAKGLTLPDGTPYSPDGKGFFQSGTEKDNTVWTVGADYHFTDKLTFGGIYSAGSAKISEQAQQNGREDSDENKSFSLQFTYGKPELKEKNNFAAWLAYRQAGRIGSYTPAYHGVGFGERGFEIGARYNILKELSIEAVYFDGRKISKIAPPAPDTDKPHIHKWYLGLSYEF